MAIPFWEIGNKDINTLWVERWRGCCIACAQDAHNIVLVSSIDEIINNRKAGSLSLSLLQNITKLNLFSEQGGKAYQEPFPSPLYNVHTGMAQ